MQTAPNGPQISPEKRQKFLSLYPNRAHHIYKTPRDPKWKYSRVQLFTGMIDGALSLQSDTFYGALWAELTKFAVLDLDETSDYHNAQELERLRETLSLCGSLKTDYLTRKSLCFQHRSPHRVGKVVGNLPGNLGKLHW